MALKNYTTSIAVEKTVAEIEQILAKHGATHVFKMYENFALKAVAFKFQIKEQLISFKLPMEEDKILQVFKLAVRRRELPGRYENDREQARRTGWRIIKDWIDSQMALLEINLVKFEEIFLPYMYDQNTDQTLFQKLEKKGFYLEDKSGESNNRSEYSGKPQS